MGRIVRKIKVDGPFAVYLPRKTTKDKRIPINMNWYRNAQFFESNQVKKLYKEMVKAALEGVTLVTPFTVTCRVYKPTKRRLDKSNVYSVSSKFMLDALVEHGVIEDDNDDYIKNELILPTIHDKENERVEFVFETVEET